MPVDGGVPEAGGGLEELGDSIVVEPQGTPKLCDWLGDDIAVLLGLVALRKSCAGVSEAWRPSILRRWA